MSARTSCILKPAAVFDVHRGECIPDRAVLVQDGRIQAVEPAETFPAAGPDVPLSIDLAGDVLLPGLINTHVHLTFSASDDPLRDYLGEDATQHIAWAVEHARQLLLSGVTTVRDCGSDWEVLSLARLAETGAILAPRLVLCGPPITPTAGHLHFMQGEADGVEAVRMAVRQRYKRGATSIKAMASGGNMTPGSFPDKACYTQEELNAIAAEAERLELPTVVHVLATESIRRAARAGFHSLEHCALFQRERHGWLERVYEAEVAEEVRRHDCAIMMGLSAGWHMRDPFRTSDQRTPHQEFLLAMERRAEEIFARLSALGIPMVVGTDAGVVRTPFDETWLELALMVRAGFSPADAIRGASLHAARVLGLGHRIGAIAPGLEADLIAVAEDPLRRIEAFRHVGWVMKGGRVVKDERRNPRHPWMVTAPGDSAIPIR
jgi:imidazolonepropionase-like amidohydrolase